MKRKLFFAVFISLILPSLGMLYLSKIKKALCYLCITLIVYAASLANVPKSVIDIDAKKILLFYNVFIGFIAVIHTVFVFKKHEMHKQNFRVVRGCLFLFVLLLFFVIKVFILDFYSVHGDVYLTHNKKVIQSGSVVLVVNKNYYDIKNFVIKALFNTNAQQYLKINDIIIYAFFFFVIILVKL